MNGKTIVMTGATSGIGAVAAKALAEQGARLIILARDRARGEAAIAGLKSGPSQQHSLHLADMLLMEDIRRAAAEIGAAEPSIDILINNAGTWFQRRELTREGLERTFAVNHMAYFVLSLELKDQLAKAQGARIINTASFFHRQKYDPSNLQAEESYSTNKVYARSKLFNILFTRELARRWKELDITVNCFNPGSVNTNFGAGEGGWLEPIFRLQKKLFGKTPEQAAETLLYLSTSSEVEGVTGQYFDERKIAKPSDEALSDANAADLWERSMALAQATQK
jgi:NAD(P)-dependent dehydrogenase (short-subunit alcohol dehydrogenase family)